MTKAYVPMHLDDTPLAFIDVEASGLNTRSWPVEVGWVLLNEDAQSMLIRPQESWPRDGWEREAEKLHGLSRDKLRREGHEPKVVCAALNTALEGYTVYSDAPDWDAFWLYRLYEVARVKPTFALHSMSKLISPMIEGRAQEVLDLADRLAPRAHRAADDALHLQTLYKIARS